MFYVDSSGSDNDEDLTGETSFDEPPHCRYYSESFHDYDMSNFPLNSYHLLI
jgi:hypothetical protein